jgi:6-methylsalicylate decarboxylase
VRNVTDDSQILFGSDWPYAPAPLTHAAISSIDDEPTIDDAFKDAITSGNARELFSRFGNRS